MYAQNGGAGLSGSVCSDVLELSLIVVGRFSVQSVVDMVYWIFRLLLISCWVVAMVYEASPGCLFEEVEKT